MAIQRFPRRVTLVTSRFPVGTTETFLQDEIAWLAARNSVFVFPVIPSMLSPRVLFTALIETFRAPRVVACAVATVVSRPRSWIAKLKNAAVVPKALFIAQRSRSLRIEHIHAYWLSAPATVAYIISKVNGTPWSATGHRYDLVDYNVTSVGVRNAGIISDAAFVRTISERGRATMCGILPPAKATLVHAVPLGIKASAKVIPTSSERLRLICAAALVPVKDHVTLLYALKLARDDGVVFDCALAGDGPERRRLQALTLRLGLENFVHFLGFVHHRELLARFHAAAYDAAILTSLDEGLERCEGIPVFLMEAMAASLPCVATASGSVPELVQHEYSGLLCTPGDVRSIAQNVGRIADASLRNVLGSAARETIERHFNVETTARRMAELFGSYRERAEAVAV